MIARPPHDRKIVFGAVSLTPQKLGKVIMPALAQADHELEEIMLAINFLDYEKFSWIGFNLMFGLKNDDIPVISRVKKKYGTLPIKIEIDTHDLIDVEHPELVKLFKVAGLKGLIYAAKKYNRPYDGFESELVRLTE